MTKALEDRVLLFLAFAFAFVVVVSLIDVCLR